MTDLKTIEQNENKTFDEIIAKPEGRKQFVEAIHNLARQKASVQRSQELLKDDVAVVADAFKVSKKRVNGLVDAVQKGTLEDKIFDANAFVEMLELLVPNEED